MEYSIQQPLQEAKALMRRVRKGAPGTRKNDTQVIRQAIKDLYHLKIYFASIKALGSADWVTLIQYWQSQALSARTLKNRTAILRKYMALLRTDSQLPDNDALNIQVTPKAVSMSIADYPAVVAQMHHPLIQLIIGLQMHFGLTKNEVLYLDLSTCIAFTDTLFIQKRHAHNSHDRLIPVVTSKQKVLLEILTQQLGEHAQLAEAYPVKSLDYLYYGELGLLGYSPHTPFRKYYIQQRYAQLSAMPLSDCIDKISEEMGLSDQRDIKKWIQAHE